MVYCVLLTLLRVYTIRTRVSSHPSRGFRPIWRDLNHAHFLYRTNWKKKANKSLRIPKRKHFKTKIKSLNKNQETAAENEKLNKTKLLLYNPAVVFILYDLFFVCFHVVHLLICYIHIWKTWPIIDPFSLSSVLLFGRRRCRPPGPASGKRV